MVFRRRHGETSPFATLREPRPDAEIHRIYRSGADGPVRARLDEFRALFTDHGRELLPLTDPLHAASIGAALSVPFLSIAELQSHPGEIVLDAIAEMATPAARAALLAMAVATDGQLEILAARAATKMGQAGEPPWVQRAYAPLKLLSTDHLLDRADDRVTALVLTFEQAEHRASFFLRLHPGLKITFRPGTNRDRLMAELTAGKGPAAPYRFTRRLRVTDDRDSLVELLGARMVRSHIIDVTPVAGLLVLLRKFLQSAYGFASWEDVSRGRRGGPS